jgi:hypothetical protein
VLRTTRSSHVWLGLLLLLPLSAATAKTPSSSTNSVSVAVYNDADAPVHLLVEAETIATRVLSKPE